MNDKIDKAKLRLIRIASVFLFTLTIITFTSMIIGLLALLALFGKA